MLPLLWCSIFILPGLINSWSLPFFPSTEELIALHRKSPSEASAETVRLRRQAYQVFVGNDHSVTVDQSGRAESGAWGPWTLDRECSRTCGGGVQIERRQCNGECTGASIRYVSCNIDNCSVDSKDFLAVQCSEHDDTPLDGNYYKWLPYPGKNKCELTCKPDTANFYYKWADKVADGTECSPDENEICVDGICLPIGCDRKLGSALKSDNCGVCGGNGSTCKIVEGFFDERNLSPGYHDIIRLPVGATSIQVEEMRPTTNSLAIKNASDHFFLNGNFQIQLMNKPLEIGGTVFHYGRRKIGQQPYETLTAKGPTDEELIITLLFQSGNKDSAIKYEFSVPFGQDLSHFYRPGEWSPCSVTCGKGVMTRKALCFATETRQNVIEEVCLSKNASKPELEKECETINCKAEWYHGEWESCSATCGDSGKQYRVVYCHTVFSDGKRMTLDDSNCTEDRPDVTQPCNRFSCPEWQAGPWSACSKQCGDAFQYRSVTCRSAKEGEEGKLVPAEECGETDLEDKRSCNLGPCDSLKFFTTEWQLCERCNDTEEKRNVTCKDRTDRAYPLEKCLNVNVTDIPPDTRACATQPPCIYEWHVSEWSKCSTDCGHGHRTRRVVCAIHEQNDLTIVDDSLCDEEIKLDNTMNCTNEEKCNGTYYTGPWSTCTIECGGGTQNRLIVCLNYDRKPASELCDEAMMPAIERDCNTDPCPTCGDVEFGCCPDNATFATGPFFKGCSNCSLSEFGCCNDNITEATGGNKLGCLEFEGEGSGEEDILPTADTDSMAEESCKVTSMETGDSAMIACNFTKLDNDTLDIESLLGNITMENVTLHCSKMEFGCCPDWITPAEGEDYLGCPLFIQGNCNNTVNGCCPDRVTQARGPNFEGCGEPSCAGSLFGCCKDRKTIAFGPHYAGCERSSYPCELSTFGCCPDGETAALGKNASGCNENCLLTKFGCCPDGITPSKGASNEGCGCKYSQYGCCPDGKISAEGPNHRGCPQTCVQGEYGCCPDGQTAARGANREGCPCQYTHFGCCPDGETSALGPNNEGCDNCRYTKHGCCHDGEAKALGPYYAGCLSTTVAPYVFGGTVAPDKIVACSLLQDQGTVCHPGYKLVWFYDSTEGRCTQFWYGGCEGNENRFSTKEQCEMICIDPPSRGRCYLPKVEGPVRCNQLSARYWYDYTTKQCGAFWWRGCLGNSNNFESWEECQKFCTGIEAPSLIPTNPSRSEHDHRSEFIQQHSSIQPQRIPIPSDYETKSHESQQTQRQSYGDGQIRGAIEMQTLTMDEICRQPVDSGPCADYVDMFYFDINSKSCNSFIYGGCDGNMNKFLAKTECEARCLHPSNRAPVRSDAETQRPIPESVRSNDILSGFTENLIRPDLAKTREACNERMDIGRCEGKFPSFYFERSTGTCEMFEYSGCGGTANRFHTKEQCEDVCLLQSHKTPPRFGDAASDASREFDDNSDEPEYPESDRISSVCVQKKDTGPCDQFVTKWYYNGDDGTCGRFHYGGCQGNENRFDSEQQCKIACFNHADPCTLPKVEGPCSGKRRRYYFDSATRRCEEFEYGGCLGNANNFMDIHECSKQCDSSSNHTQSFKAKPDFCNLPNNVGPCRGHFKQYYHDSSVRKCLPFVYGGCDGNENRFSTYDECMLTCSIGEPMQALEMPRNNESFTRSEEKREGKTDIIEQHVTKTDHSPIVFTQLSDDINYATIRPHSHYSSLPELCLLPEDKGPCFGEILRWRYDSEAEKCVTFLYSGCEHNANFFTSEEACDRACGIFSSQDICGLQADNGSCNLGVIKWYYNQQTSQCHAFMYSGCRGNGNRFSSKAECRNLCTSESKIKANGNICHYDRDSGPCTDAVTQWFYDKGDLQCKQFTYGGCRGNPNRFNTKQECENRCIGTQKDKYTALINKKKVCQFPFDFGACMESHEKWFFDRVAGYCQKFIYSGCGGNANRFDNEIGCWKMCSSSSEQNRSATKRATAELLDGTHLKAGNTITLKCNSHGKYPIRWMKDGLTYGTNWKSDALAKVVGTGSWLIITQARVEDSGSYACKAGENATLSNSIIINISPPAFEMTNCADAGNERVCRLIVKNSLCSNERYKTFCCESCISALRLL